MTAEEISKDWTAEDRLNVILTKAIVIQRYLKYHDKVYEMVDEIKNLIVKRPDYLERNRELFTRELE